MKRPIAVTLLVAWAFLLASMPSQGQQTCSGAPQITSFSRAPSDPVPVGQLVGMTVAATNAPGCEFLDYFWELIDKPVGSTVYLPEINDNQIAITPDVAGTYLVVVSVFNETEGEDSHQELIVVVPCNAPPTAEILSVSPDNTVTLGEAVLLTGRGVNPAACSELTLSWQLAAKPAGSGAALNPSTGASSALVPDVAGGYRVVFTAQNEAGSATDGAAITGVVEFGVETPQDDGTGQTNAINQGVPTITGINPSSGVPGMAIVLTGANFSLVLEKNLVFFGSARATVVAATATTLTVLVPELPDGEYAVTVTVSQSSLRRSEGASKARLTLAPEAARAPDGPLLAQSNSSNIILFDVDGAAAPRPLSGIDLDAGFVVGELVLFLKPGVGELEIEALRQAFDMTSLVHYATLGFYRARFQVATPAQTLELVNLLNVDPRVERAFLNRLVDVLQAAEPQVNRQDWLLDLGLPAGYDAFFPKQGEGVTIAVIDTGADLTLPSLEVPELALPAAAPQGLNFSPNTTDPSAQDELGHGTIVSTIAAASANRFNGLGVAPRATVLPLKVFAVVGGKVKATNEGVSQALLQAFQLEVDVINLSLGCQGCSRDTEANLRDFYKRVLDNLIADQTKNKLSLPIVVAASGNDGENLIDSPAGAHPDVIAVGSARADLGGRSSFSNYGPELDFLAMGENTSTTLLGGEFANGGSGTSFAAPQLAGLVALILAQQPGLNVGQVRQVLKDCFVADLGPPGFDEETGWGRVVVPAQRAPGCAFGA